MKRAAGRIRIASSEAMFRVRMVTLYCKVQDNVKLELSSRWGSLRNQFPDSFVSLTMPNNHARFGAPEGLYVTGAVFFTLVLMLSALWDASIRWLHFFQASMYIATLVLGLRKNRWGYFIGISAAGLWDYLNIFATTFFFNGMQQLSQWIHTGHLQRPDLLIAVPTWFSNLFIVIGCLWGVFPAA